MTLLPVAKFKSAKTFKLLAKDRLKLAIDVHLHMVREIIFDHFGFRLWMQGSGQTFTFFQMEIDKKNQLINAIKSNAKRYMDTEIHVTGNEHTSSSIVGSC